MHGELSYWRLDTGRVIRCAANVTLRRPGAVRMSEEEFVAWQKGETPKPKKTPRKTTRKKAATVVSDGAIDPDQILETLQNAENVRGRDTAGEADSSG